MIERDQSHETSSPLLPPPLFPTVAHAGLRKVLAAAAHQQQQKEKGVGWMFLGGAASASAAICTHPIDLVKVRMQTNKQAIKVGGTVTERPPGMVRTALNVMGADGIRGLYGGLSASLGRQLSYSTVRFGAYDVLKVRREAQGLGEPDLLSKIGMSMVAGGIGGVAGNPFDVANVRMQNDRSLPLEERRNYRNVGDAVVRMAREEGITSLYRGLSLNVQRAMLMTAGQLASYDQIKQVLLTQMGGLFQDNIVTHFTASLGAAGVATTICQPVDVIKTRVMTAAPGTYKSGLDCFGRTVAGEGPLALFKGLLPSFTRLGPQTILTFIFLEQFRKLYLEHAL